VKRFYQDVTLNYNASGFKNLKKLLVRAHHFDVMNNFESVNCVGCYVCNSLDCLYMHCVFDTYQNLELSKDPNLIPRRVMYNNITNINV